MGRRLGDGAEEERVARNAIIIQQHNNLVIGVVLVQYNKEQQEECSCDSACAKEQIKQKKHQKCTKNCFMLHHVQYTK